MSTIFENAKFGDKFRLRNGMCSLFLHKCTGPGEAYHLVTYTDADTYAPNGKLYSIKDYEEESEFDVIEKCVQEFVDSDNLREYANNQTSKELGYEFDEHDYTDHSGSNAYWSAFRDGFISGYKNGIKNNPYSESNIPITEEFITSLGFIKDDEKHFHYKNIIRIRKYNYCSLWKLEIGNDPEADVLGYLDIDIKYINDLIDALRVCKINDLIDKLKPIEK